ncbi:transcriptional coactivator p15/PC4 family protein [uncultured Roseobacter sp.]|uniref:transcriptional coactivator p15/PC4 family protein n=1 Tax=uncultured Roseobacter sp. TaxID=114847 RepID=UPI002611473C|nr:transcriptional coactivator p15/PC4 family protein [uncultured Roseobacter sp.]
MADHIEIQKNSREVFRISRGEFRGNDMVNIRVFYQSEGGDKLPGKQGVAIKATLLPEVLDAVQSLMSEGAA